MQREQWWIWFILPEHLSSRPFFSGVRVTRSLALCECFVDRFLSFWPFLLKYYFINYNVLLSLDSVPCFSSLQMNVVKSSYVISWTAISIYVLQNWSTNMHNIFYYAHLSSRPFFSGVRVTRSLALCECFVDRFLSFWPFFFWSLCCLSFKYFSSR
jgi:hypothetical protein